MCISPWFILRLHNPSQISTVQKLCNHCNQKSRSIELKNWPDWYIQSLYQTISTLIFLVMQHVEVKEHTEDTRSFWRLLGSSLGTLDLTIQETCNHAECDFFTASRSQVSKRISRVTKSSGGCYKNPRNVLWVVGISQLSFCALYSQ